MPVDMAIWSIAGLFSLAVLAVVLLPMLRNRGRGGRRASYDMQIYRDQLREVDADLARGVLSGSEAEGTRREISRKLLASADAEAAEQDARAAPRGLSLGLGAGLLAGLAAVAAALYATLGAPGYPDQPLDRRIAERAAAFAARPDQEAAEAMLNQRSGAAERREAVAEGAELVDRLQQVLADRPDDVEGHRLLARSLAALGRFGEARAAQSQVVEILGDDAGAGDRVDLAELMILAAGGFVSPQAEAQLERALTLAPGNPRGRYYAGLMQLQAGRPDLTYPIWTALLSEGPPEAPWVAAIDADIAEVARLAGRAAPQAVGRPTPAAGPSRGEMEAAAAMTPEEQTAMIEGMVDRLGARLAEDGGPATDWAQLVRALGVLGRRDEAEAIWTEAQVEFADDADGLSTVRGAAREAGLVQ